MKIIVAQDSKSLPNNVEPIVNGGHPFANYLLALGYKADHLPLVDLITKSQQLSGSWAMISPVHWVASHNDVQVVAQGAELFSDSTESQNCFETFVDFFKAEDLALHYFDSGLWLIKTDSLPDFRDIPVYQLKNRSMMPVLSKLDESLLMQKLLTELQMWLSTNSLNTLRQEDGKLTVNGAWIWGSQACKLSAKKPVKVAASPHYIQVLSSSDQAIDGLDMNLDLRQYDIILADDLTSLSQMQIQVINQQVDAWYFNNLSWQLSKQSWWQKIRRAFTNADKTKKGA